MDVATHLVREKNIRYGNLSDRYGYVARVIGNHNIQFVHTVLYCFRIPGGRNLGTRIIYIFVINEIAVNISLYSRHLFIVLYNESKIRHVSKFLFRRLYEFHGWTSGIWTIVLSGTTDHCDKQS